MSLPIEDYALIGDLHSVALVGTDGAIDWLCLPRFDSPSVFGSILDAERGGSFRIAPARAGAETKQLYLPDTNVLITRFLSRDGVGEVHDFMPIHRDPQHRRRLVRRVLAVRGEVAFRVECQPHLDYGRELHELELGAGGAIFRSASLVLALSTDVPLERTGSGVEGTFVLQGGE